MPRLRVGRRSARTDDHPAAQDDVAPQPPRPPRFRFATLDPGLRLERRSNPERRAKVDIILATITDPQRREEYLRTVRSSARRYLSG